MWPPASRCWCRFISYNYIWYEYSNEEFSFYSGIISKKRAHVPYQRIQSINQKATLFQRIAGVCTVSIETAGGASNTAITLPYIEKSAAEALRKELFARKQFAQMKAAGVEIPAGMTTEHAAETLGAALRRALQPQRSLLPQARQPPLFLHQRLHQPFQVRMNTMRSTHLLIW